LHQNKITISGKGHFEDFLIMIDREDTLCHQVSFYKIILAVP